MTLEWVGLKDAVARVLAGDIVNSIAVSGILATHAVVCDGHQPRALDVAWPTRPVAFAARKGASS
jgi:ADP-ribose pyrophosphatase